VRQAAARGDTRRLVIEFVPLLGRRRVGQSDSSRRGFSVDDGQQ
jgi:hypothetical protein